MSEAVQPPISPLRVLFDPRLQGRRWQRVLPKWKTVLQTGSADPPSPDGPCRGPVFGRRRGRGGGTKIGI